MENIQFEENDLPGMRPVRAEKKTQESKIAVFLIRKGIVKDEKQATYALGALSIAALLLAAFILWSTFSTSGPKPLSPLNVTSQQMESVPRVQ